MGLATVTASSTAVARGAVSLRRLEMGFLADANALTRMGTMVGISFDIALQRTKCPTLHLETLANACVVSAKQKRLMLHSKCFDLYL
jgi:hypothetical protein